MARAEVWVHTDTKIIRADTIRSVGWAPGTAGPVVLELAVSGEKQPVTIRVQPDLPKHFFYDEATGTNGDVLRNRAHEAAWERAKGMDEGLLHAIANGAKIPGGAVVFLGHDNDEFPTQWETEPLAFDTPASE